MEKTEIKTRWTTDEMTKEFDVIGFGYGYCAVKRKSDGQKGSLDFGGSPRIYYKFIASN